MASLAWSGAVDKGQVGSGAPWYLKVLVLWGDTSLCAAHPAPLSDASLLGGHVRPSSW